MFAVVFRNGWRWTLAPVLAARQQLQARRPWLGFYSVLIFAVLLSFSVSKVSKWLDKVTAAEKWVRRIAAVVCIGVGIYYVVLWAQS